MKLRNLKNKIKRNHWGVIPIQDIEDESCYSYNKEYKVFIENRYGIDVDGTHRGYSHINEVKWATIKEYVIKMSKKTGIMKVISGH